MKKHKLTQREKEARKAEQARLLASFAEIELSIFYRHVADLIKIQQETPQRS